MAAAAQNAQKLSI